MTDPLPTAIAAVLDRVGLPDERDAPLPPEVTGELARLLLWWRSVSSQVVPTPGHVATPEAPRPASEAMAAGFAAADRAIDSGATVIVPVPGPGDLRSARTLIALLSRREASSVLAQPEGMPDTNWMAECAAIRDAIRDAVDLRPDPLGLLDAVGGHRIAFLVGVLLESAARRTPCLVDGTEPSAAALVADRMSYRAKAWWREGATSTDPARRMAVDRVDLTPGLPLGLADECGMGAAATLALLPLAAVLASAPPQRG
ncbi:MAG: nicotinate-nucleotide--dimethylbenzimidazole phosphoribosyltransferase [Actinobacteria bacterium]|nr:nicotinate-nucleotide--dimethylbenzimidazole phosphoribosyltransferase [Actinomycetota bacterium]